jgi:outer membrane protein assembly factor BamB
MLSPPPPVVCLQSGDDWPQWRGADGMGVSSATGLPTALGPSSPELLWKSAVPGEGIASPVVSGGRVYLTTAYRGELGGGLGLLSLAIPLLSLLALALLFRRRAEPGAERGFARVLARLDGLALVLGTLAFVAAASVTSLRPGLFFEAGSPGYRWFYTGAIGLFGLAVAGGWFPARSRARLLDVLVVLVSACLLYRYIPQNKYAESFRASVRLTMLVPGLGWAAWHVLVLFVTREAPARRSTPTATAGALALAGVAAAFFTRANFVAPAVGLVRAVTCFDLERGTLLWDTPVFVAPEEKKYPKNSYATPTVCVTRDAVFAHFGAGYAALDLDGKVRWKSVDPDFPARTRYGASTSPVLVEDSVVYVHDKEIGLGESYAVRIRLADGAELWRRTSDTNHDSYTTPLLVERAGEPELVTVTHDRLFAYDPRTGDETWSTPIPVQQMVPSLQLRGDLLLVSGGSHLKSSTSGLRLAGSGRSTRVEVLWQTRRAVPAIASPVWVGDGFFNVTDGGILTCYDPESGDTRWQERLPGAYWASLVAGDGKVYALNDEGLLTTFRAGHAFETLAQGDFASPCYATPAIAAGCVLVRTEKDLYCFRAQR